MELALLLVFLVFVELAFTVWFLARQRYYSKRVKRLERNVTKLAQVVADDKADVLDASPIAGNVDMSGLAAAINTASPEDIAQALEFVNSLGLGKDE